jgi:hypothetical protein
VHQDLLAVAVVAVELHVVVVDLAKHQGPAAAAALETGLVEGLARVLHLKEGLARILHLHLGQLLSIPAHKGTALVH